MGKIIKGIHIKVAVRITEKMGVRTSGRILVEFPWKKKEKKQLKKTVEGYLDEFLTELVQEYVEEFQDGFPEVSWKYPIRKSLEKEKLELEGFFDTFFRWI